MDQEQQPAYEGDIGGSGNFGTNQNTRSQANGSTHIANQIAEQPYMQFDQVSPQRQPLRDSAKRQKANEASDTRLPEIISSRSSVTLNNNNRKMGLGKGKSQNQPRDEVFQYQKDPMMNNTFEQQSNGRKPLIGPVKARAGSHINKDIRYKTQENMSDLQIAKQSSATMQRGNTQKRSTIQQSEGVKPRIKGVGENSQKPGLPPSLMSQQQRLERIKKHSSVTGASSGATVFNTQHPIGTGTGATTYTTPNIVQTNGVGGLPPKSCLAQQSLSSFKQEVGASSRLMTGQSHRQQSKKRLETQQSSRTSVLKHIGDSDRPEKIKPNHNRCQSEKKKDSFKQSALQKQQKDKDILIGGSKQQNQLLSRQHHLRENSTQLKKESHLSSPQVKITDTSDIQNLKSEQPSDHSPLDPTFKRSYKQSFLKEDENEQNDESSNSPEKDGQMPASNQSSNQVMAKLRHQQRNEKLLADLAQKRLQQANQSMDKAKYLADKKARLREQVQKKNAEMIKQMNEAKAQKEEQLKKEQEEKLQKEQQVEKVGPSSEFFERLQKSKKQKQPPITDWNVFRKRHELEPNQKIFICSNAYQPLIDELLRRGWYRNKDRKSGIFHLKYVILEAESSMMDDLKPFQLVNHFLKNNLIVTKTGLQRSLKNLVWWSTIPQDLFFPKCYDLTDFKELDEFKEDFRVNRAESILKRYIQKKKCNHIEKLLIAIHINEKRLKDVDDVIDDPDLENLVTDQEWQYIEKEKFQPDQLEQLLKEDWYQQIQIRYQDKCNGELVQENQEDDNTKKGNEKEESEEDPIEEESGEDENDESNEKEEQTKENEENDEFKEKEKEPTPQKEVEVTIDSQDKPKTIQDIEFEPIENKSGNFAKLYEYVQDLCSRLKEKFLQFNMNGTENLWLLKPGSSSRGRGIKVYKTYERVVNRINNLKGNTRLWVVQKCIENPLIIEGRKFDIRQWVLVTDWNPLTIWCYNECYIRFCVQEYDPKADSRKNHLTNHSVQKKYAEFEYNDIDGNMWSCEEFTDYLNDEFGEGTYQDKIWPQIKKYVKASLMSVKDQVDNRKNSFEFFGYDLMVDQDLRVWLIEVNSSPTMEKSTPTTERLVDMVLTDLPKVILDYPNSNYRKNFDTGGFIQVHRDNYEVQRPQNVNLSNFQCEGKKIEIKKPKKVPKNSKIQENINKIAKISDINSYVKSEAEILNNMANAAKQNMKMPAASQLQPQVKLNVKTVDPEKIFMKYYEENSRHQLILDGSEIQQLNNIKMINQSINQPKLHINNMNVQSPQKIQVQVPEPKQTQSIGMKNFGTAFPQDQKRFQDPFENQFDKSNMSNQIRISGVNQLYQRDGHRSDENLF